MSIGTDDKWIEYLVILNKINHKTIYDNNLYIIRLYRYEDNVSDMWLATYNNKGIIVKGDNPYKDEQLDNVHFTIVKTYNGTDNSYINNKDKLYNAMLNDDILVNNVTYNGLSIAKNENVECITKHTNTLEICIKDSRYEYVSNIYLATHKNNHFYLLDVIKYNIYEEKLAERMQLTSSILRTISDAMGSLESDEEKEITYTIVTNNISSGIVNSTTMDSLIDAKKESKSDEEFEELIYDLTRYLGEYFDEIINDPPDEILLPLMDEILLPLMIEQGLVDEDTEEVPKFMRPFFIHEYKPTIKGSIINLFSYGFHNLSFGYSELKHFRDDMHSWYRQFCYDIVSDILTVVSIVASVATFGLSSVAAVTANAATAATLSTISGYTSLTSSIVSKFSTGIDAIAAVDSIISHSNYSVAADDIANYIFSEALSYGGNILELVVGGESGIAQEIIKHGFDEVVDIDTENSHMITDAVDDIGNNELSGSTYKYNRHEHQLVNIINNMYTELMDYRNTDKSLKSTYYDNNKNKYGINTVCVKEHKLPAVNEANPVECPDIYKALESERMKLDSSKDKYSNHKDTSFTTPNMPHEAYNKIKNAKSNYGLRKDNESIQPTDKAMIKLLKQLRKYETKNKAKVNYKNVTMINSEDLDNIPLKAIEEYIGHLKREKRATEPSEEGS